MALTFLMNTGFLKLPKSNKFESLFMNCTVLLNSSHETLDQNNDAVSTGIQVIHSVVLFPCGWNERCSCTECEFSTLTAPTQCHTGKK